MHTNTSNNKYDSDRRTNLVVPQEESKPISLLKMPMKEIDCIDINDDSDNDEITCLGTFNFSSKISENTNCDSIKEEKQITPIKKYMNPCVLTSREKSESESQEIVPMNRANRNTERNTTLTEQNSNSSISSSGENTNNESQDGVPLNYELSDIQSHLTPVNQNVSKSTLKDCTLEENPNPNRGSLGATGTPSGEELNILNKGANLDHPTMMPVIQEVLNKELNKKNTTQFLTNNAGTKSFGNNIKHQVRYVQLPAKFPTTRDNIVIAQTSSNGLPIGVSQSMNSSTLQHVQATSPMKIINLNTILKIVPNSQKIGQPGSQTYHNVKGQRQAVNMLPVTKTTFVNNTETNINKGSVNNINESRKELNNGPPGKIIVGNKVFKLKGIKQADQSKATCKVNCSNEVNQPTDNDNPKKVLVDQESQTDIYCWLYKNNKLYSIVNDAGSHVTLVPVENIRVEKPPVDLNVGSPLSSLDAESVGYLDDEEMETNEPVSDYVIEPEMISNVTANTEEASNSNSKTVTNLPSNPTNSYCPKNAFDEVLFTDLGLYNPPPKQTEESPTNVSVSLANNCHDNSIFAQNTNTLRGPSNVVLNQEYQSSLAGFHNFENSPQLIEGCSENACINGPQNSIISVFSNLCQDIRTCLSSDTFGNIPLHQAVINNHLTKLRSQCIVLKTIGSHLNHVNLDNETALMLAVKIAVETEDYEAVSILVAEGADQQITDKNGDTPLHYSVRRGNSHLVRVLLTSDDAEKVTEKYCYDGFTPLHLAAIEGHDDIIKQLVSTNIDVNIKDRKNGRTPYFLAVKEKNLTSAELLKMFGANIYEPNFADLSPVYVSPGKQPDPHQPEPLCTESRSKENQTTKQKIDKFPSTQPKTTKPSSRQPQLGDLPSIFCEKNTSIIAKHVFNKSLSDKFENDKPTVASGRKEPAAQRKKKNRAFESSNMEQIIERYREIEAKMMDVESKKDSEAKKGPSEAKKSRSTRLIQKESTNATPQNKDAVLSDKNVISENNGQLERSFNPVTFSGHQDTSSSDPSSVHAQSYATGLSNINRESATKSVSNLVKPTEVTKNNETKNIPVPTHDTVHVKKSSTTQGRFVQHNFDKQQSLLLSQQNKSKESKLTDERQSKKSGNSLPDRRNTSVTRSVPQVISVEKHKESQSHSATLIHHGNKNENFNMSGPRNTVSFTSRLDQADQKTSSSSNHSVVLNDSIKQNFKKLQQTVPASSKVNIEATRLISHSMIPPAEEAPSYTDFPDSEVDGGSLDVESSRGIDCGNVKSVIVGDLEPHNVLPDRLAGTNTSFCDINNKTTTLKLQKQVPKGICLSFNSYMENIEDDNEIDLKDKTSKKSQVKNRKRERKREIVDTDQNQELPQMPKRKRQQRSLPDNVVTKQNDEANRQNDTWKITSNSEDNQDRIPNRGRPPKPIPDYLLHQKTDGTKMSMASSICFPEPSEPRSGRNAGILRRSRTKSCDSNIKSPEKKIKSTDKDSYPIVCNNKKGKQSVTSDINTRRSTRIVKKRVEFDL